MESSELLFSVTDLCRQSYSTFSAILIIIPMLVVGLISYMQSSQILEEQARIHNFQAIEQVESHIEYYVRDFEISTLKILNHPDMLRFLQVRTHEEAEAEQHP